VTSTCLKDCGRTDPAKWGWLLKVTSSSPAVHDPVHHLPGNAPEVHSVEPPITITSAWLQAGMLYCSVVRVRQWRYGPGRVSHRQGDACGPGWRGYAWFAIALPGVARRWRWACEHCAGIQDVSHGWQHLSLRSITHPGCHTRCCWLLSSIRGRRALRPAPRKHIGITRHGKELCWKLMPRACCATAVREREITMGEGEEHWL
jgi:hypothetical protein